MFWDATVRQRNCRFGHESNLTHFPIYTKNLCIQECRLRLVYEVCKCIPHFYPNRVNKPKRVCDYHTLKRCFPPNKDYFLKLYRQRGDSQEIDTAPCYCDQNCRDSVVSATHQVDTSEYIHGNGATMTMTEWPSLQYRREVYLTFTDLLVYIGGTAGLFIGFNVLGAIEIVYFFTMRLLFKLLGYKL
ncbi:acid-sensing ion channel 5-like [Stomoxys calcitrans]|uniref:acid-sensing ion channel 5-like n=1 Tax=Stomoxys calcitrans TaxID=35570 RepID=UPI0027E31286|nr:acid-sensing ion channel 5-like [Stomoxys calcitrans]